MAVADDGLAGADFDLFQQGVGIYFHVAGVLVGVDAEVAEFAASAAKGNVKIETERSSRLRRSGETLPSRGKMSRLPERERRVVRHEVIAEAGFFLIGGFGHV